MTSAVCPPRSLFTVTGQSPRFWSRPPVRCLHSFTYATFSTSTMVSCLWVRLWLRARGSGTPHLFLTCSRGGGGPARSWFLLLLGFFTCFGAGCGACPTSADSVLEILPILSLLFYFAIHFNLLRAFCLFSL